MSDTVITMDDFMKAGHCAKGVRRWFHDHGLNFQQFMREGVAADVILATGDAHAHQVVARTIARRTTSNG